MKLYFYYEPNKSIIPDIYRLSELMKDGNETLRGVFTVTHETLLNSKGIFFTVEQDNIKIGYGLLAYGIDDPGHRRIVYLTTEVNIRRKGIGTKIVKKLLNSHEIDLECGITLTCTNKLKEFYEKLDFQHMGEAKESGNIIQEKEISFAYADSNEVINSKSFGSWQAFGIREPDIFPTYQKFEEKYNIKLMGL